MPTGPRYLGVCNLCDLRVFRTEDGIEVRKQGGGRPPETPHKHKKPYTVAIPVPATEDEDHGWRGWMDYAHRMGAY